MPTSSEPKTAGAAMATKELMRPIGVELLHIGHCLAPLPLTQRAAPWRIGRFPAGIAALDHPRHRMILFDTGYGRAFWQATHAFPERIYRWLTPPSLPDGASLPEQLQPLGPPKHHPALIILSHLHADHIAGLFDLDPLPPVIAPAQALDELNRGGRIATLRAGCPELLRQRLKALPIRPIESLPPADLTAHGLAAFGRGHDLLGDGSVISVPLPGHGIGQTGVFLPHSRLGPLFLVADAIWSLAALVTNSPPPDATLRRLGDAYPPSRPKAES
jgi:glyoxylase-like metal-dependent hydrolase (beta-lactamase superfamily II)